MLQGLNIDYQYLPGDLNPQADSLSRFLYDEVSMHTEHVEALAVIAEAVPADYTLVFAQEEWVDGNQTPERFEVHTPEAYRRMLQSTAQQTRNTRLFVKILDTTTRDKSTVERTIASGKPCCFILPMEIYGEMFGAERGNRIAFLERGTVAVLRNVKHLWDDRLHTRGPARPRSSEDRTEDVDTLLTMDTTPDTAPHCAQVVQVPDQMIDANDEHAFQELVIDTHVSAFHAGAERVYSILAPVLPLRVPIPDKRRGRTTATYWEKRIRSILTPCAICPQVKAGRKRPETKYGSSLLRPAAPHEAMSMDFHTLGESSDGYKHILTVIDMGSRRVRLIKTKDRKSDTVAHALLNNVILEQGTFKTLMSDQAPEFKTAVVRKLCEILGIKQVMCAPHSPWSRGVVERVHREVNVGVRTLEDPKNWPRVIKAIEFAVNTTKHAGTGVSPMEMEYLHPVTHFRVHDLLSEVSKKRLEVMEELAGAKEAMEAVRESARQHQAVYVDKYLQKLNKNRHDVEHKLGDRVLAPREETQYALNTRRYKQPAVVTKIDGKKATVRYELDDKEAEVHRQGLIVLGGDALELTEQAMYGFERSVTPAIGGTQENPLPPGTMAFVEDEHPGKIQLAEITGIQESGGGELVYEVHYWYTTTGKKNSWKPAWIHREDQTTVDAPRQNAKVRDRDPWTGLHDFAEVRAAGFVPQQAHTEANALKKEHKLSVTVQSSARSRAKRVKRS
jgi:transposase InsO family protein